MDTDALLAGHRAMALSREIERFCIGRSPHWYPGVGEEAVVIGAFGALQEGDLAVPHYRGALIVQWLRGRALEDVLACVVQRESSPTGGRLYGSFAGALELGVMPYVTMVLGPNLGVAVGAALAFERRGERRVVVCSFGDGTAGTGDFHESLNLAGALHLPCVFVCQNNQFSISTSTQATLAGRSIADWAGRYGMPAQQVDGNDVAAVRDAVLAGQQRARDGGGPCCIEALTYRRTGHFGADPAAYRADEDASDWEGRDPIAQAEEALLATGVDDAALKETREWAETAVGEAARSVEARPRLTPGADLLEERLLHV